MAIKVEMLRYFVEVAKAGNLSVAAANLSRSASAVSMMLKQLEEELGGALFEAERKTRLTPLGEFTYAESLREVQHFERTILAIRRYAHSQDGVIRVASVPSAAASVLPLAVGALQNDNPGVRVEVSDAATLGVLSLVQSGAVDMGLLSTAPERLARDFRARPVLKDRFGIVCRADHPFVTGERTTKWDDLRQQNFIDNELSGQIDAPGVRAAAAGSRLFVRNVLSLMAFIQAGMGVTVLPELACLKLPPDLAFVTPGGEPIHRHITLVARGQGKLSPVAATFEQLLIEAASRLPERVLQKT